MPGARSAWVSPAPSTPRRGRTTRPCRGRWRAGTATSCSARGWTASCPGPPVASRGSRFSGGIHDEDRRAQEFLSARAADWLSASGASRVARRPPPGPGPSGGQHQAGTARTGTDPARSVTDPFGRVWGYRNLRVVDASLHVTNGGVNPVLTVLAGAARIADDMVRGSTRRSPA
ncbi:GMC oxidoreductase [Kineococcus sp. NBC_00420]|uniref:GMC oxidoreductase n=1 Tax=Kineococcus sp. NBC_00420 TaxID=2903564 RepID=UPI003FA5333A